MRESFINLCAFVKRSLFTLSVYHLLFNLDPQLPETGSPENYHTTLDTSPCAQLAAIIEVKDRRVSFPKTNEVTRNRNLRGARRHSSLASLGLFRPEFARVRSLEGRIGVPVD